MFDLLRNVPHAERGADDSGYFGPERRRDGFTPLWHWLKATLDELDYGIVLLTDRGRVAHVNHAARADLDQQHPLQIVGHELRARRASDAMPLLEAVRGAAEKNLRKLLTVGQGEQRISVSVVPIDAPIENRMPVVVMLGKRRVCEVLSVQGFAHSHGLTSAEMRVLAELCAGATPNEAAERLGVKIATVRTQIGSIRLKTGAESIRDLVRQVAVLPPLRGVLRGVGSPHAYAVNDEGLLRA